MAAVILHMYASIFPWPLFAIDPLSVYILIDVVHLLIKYTEIYISAELSKIAHG